MSTTPSPVLVRPYRAIVGSGQPIIADAVVEENGQDDMTITDNPVEAGSVITDNAYKNPSDLDVVYAWSMGSSQNTAHDVSFLKNLYQQFLNLEAARTLLQVYTGKRIYQNMLIKTLFLKTDQYNENSMSLRVTLREILIATTQTVNLTPAAAQSIPTKTAPTVDQGVQNLQGAPNFNAGTP